MPYTHTTFGQAKTQLAARLRDKLNQYWPDADIGHAIIEAMYTWQALTGYWRDRGVFNTVSGTMIYNLHTVLSSILGFNILSSSSIAAMQYSLLEPATPAAWSGSSMFTLTDLTTALQNRRNQFLLDSGAVLTPITQPITVTPRQQLPDTVINLSRVVYKTPANTRHSLFENTEYNMSAYDPTWAVTPGTPEVYSIISTPPLVVQFMPPPNDTGTLELVVVQTPANIDPTVAGNLVNVPDNFEWVLRWGALADLLLREGEAYDPTRGQYALSRYNHGVRVAMEMPIGIQWELQGIPVLPSGILESDVYDPDWHNSSDAPIELLTLGNNLVSTNPIADGIYAITVDAIVNAPVPTADADFLQIGRQDLTAILGYAEHIASFKLGTAEFMATMPLFEDFLRQAVAHNVRIRAINDYVLTNIQSLYTVQRPSVPLESTREEQ